MTRWVLIGTLLISCSSSGDDDDDDDDVIQVDAAAGDPDAVPAIMVPDPGNSTNAWRALAECCGTPQTAHQVGTANLNNPYVEGTADVTTGNVYYVFKTGAGFTSLTINAFPAGADVTGVHLHDADGLVFGDLVTPSQSTGTSGTWAVQVDHVYVLEVTTAGGGFF